LIVARHLKISIYAKINPLKLEFVKIMSFLLFLLRCV